MTKQEAIEFYEAYGLSLNLIHNHWIDNTYHRENTAVFCTQFIDENGNEYIPTFLISVTYKQEKSILYASFKFGRKFAQCKEALEAKKYDLQKFKADYLMHLSGTSIEMVGKHDVIAEAFIYLMDLLDG